MNNQKREELVNFDKDVLKSTTTKNFSQTRSDVLKDVQKKKELKRVFTQNKAEERSDLLSDLQKGKEFWEMKKVKPVNLSEDRSHILHDIQKQKWKLKKINTTDKSKPVVSLFNLIVEQQTMISEMKTEIKVLQNSKLEQDRQIKLLRGGFQFLREAFEKFDELEEKLHSEDIKELTPEDRKSILQEVVSFDKKKELKKTETLSKAKQREDLLSDIRKGSKKDLERTDTKIISDDRNELLSMLRKGSQFWQLKRVNTKEESLDRNELLKDIKKGSEYWQLKKVKSFDRKKFLDDIKKAREQKLAHVKTTFLTSERKQMFDDIRRKLANLKHIETKDKTKSMLNKKIGEKI